jgi:uncharacterized protein YlzI (FlbEa/FlbD family)
MKLAQFTDADDKVVIYINPEKVRHVRPGPDGGTVIEYDNGHKVLVSGQMEAVVRKLMDA